MRRIAFLAPLLLAACGGQPEAPAASKADGMVRISLPDDPTTKLGGSNAALIERNCLACHSVEMITTQPKLPAEKWAATIEKMRTVYGAQIAKGDDAALVAALASAQE
ncbi:cytochrome C nitrite reductase [uncultured Sphingomonas sp.]|uniref:cytochrome C nitrite reductase n=1 Tax=uncultured Sphingomonas sp. TaxID=158754 RepID=UPI00374A3AA4